MHRASAQISNLYLKDIIRSILRTVQNRATLDISNYQPDDLMTKLNDYTSPPVQMAAAPRTDAKTHNDREVQIAAAKNYASSVLECANPNLRTFLENAFRDSSRHSYEVWQYLTEKDPANMVGGMYQIVPQPPLFGGEMTNQQPFIQ